MALNIGSLLQTGASAFGGPWGAVAGGLLGGLFGGGPKLPPEMQRLLKLQLQAARGMRDFSRSVPLSSPMERAALAQQHGLLGEQQRDQTGMLMGALNPNVMTSTPDMLMNLSNQQVGQRSSLDMAALLDAQRRRQDALAQSAQIAQGAVGAASQYQPGIDFGSLLGQLGQSLAYQQRMRQGNQPTQRPVYGSGSAYGMPRGSAATQIGTLAQGAVPPWLRR